MRFFYIAPVLLCCSLHLFSQKTVLYGLIKDKESKSLVDNVNISCNSTLMRAGTGGFYAMPVNSNEMAVLKFSRTGYNQYTKTITKDQLNGKDSLRLDIFLIPAVIELSPVEISAVENPDTVIGNNSFFVQDFEFAGTDLLLLTTDRSTDAWSVQLASEEQKILSRFPIPVNDVIRLYRDFLGYINVICKEEVYRVKIKNKKIILQQLPKKDFDWMIKPCVDTINAAIYFSNYRDDYPRFSYFAYNKNDSTKVFVRSVVDKDLELEYAFEYEFLKPHEKLYARKIEQQTGIDKHDVAAYMTDFAHSRWFTPLYAPMFIIRDTVLIFDHYTDKIYKYDSHNKSVDSIPISYHHPKKWREWRRQLLKDDSTSSIYGIFLKDGYTYLKEIDTHTGEIASVSRLSFQFVSNVKVKNGYGYYIYRPFGSLQTKFLYREKLSSAH